MRGPELLLSGLTVTFLKELGFGIGLTLPLLLSLALVITALGQIAGRVEGWRKFDSFYWSFITATTIGYGDLRPTKVMSRLMAILIGLLGLTFTGIVIAIAVHAAALALSVHDAIK
jgi:voltage-gated potassium channel